jgi:hypothetical protein
VAQCEGPCHSCWAWLGVRCSCVAMSAVSVRRSGMSVGQGCRGGMPVCAPVMRMETWAFQVGTDEGGGGGGGGGVPLMLC